MMMKKALKKLALGAGALVLLSVLSAFGLLAVSGGFQRIAYRPHAPTARSHATWDEVLAHPSAITVTTLEVGSIQMDLAANLDPDAPELKTLFLGQERRIPVLAHLIHHPARGDLVIDTGLDRSFAESASGNYSAAARLFTSLNSVVSSVERGGDLASQLAARSIRPKAVFFTHLHFDHTSGAPALPSDIDYVFDKNELTVMGKAILGAHLDGKAKIEVLDFSGVEAMAPLGPAIDLFGDGSLWAISTPGHTDGHVSYLVNAASGPVLLIGDASHVRRAFEHGVAARGLSNEATKRARVTLAQLKEFVRLHPNVKTVFGHGL
jgi:glyoxylase-like metal-dependent hydrolase (beta-lactamase superfamily II)